MSLATAILIASFTALAAACIAFLARPKMDDPLQEPKNWGER